MTNTTLVLWRSLLFTKRRLSGNFILCFIGYLCPCINANPFSLRFQIEEVKMWLEERFRASKVVIFINYNIQMCRPFLFLSLLGGGLFHLVCLITICRRNLVIGFLSSVAKLELENLYVINHFFSCSVNTSCLKSHFICIQKTLIVKFFGGGVKGNKIELELQSFLISI